MKRNVMVGGGMLVGGLVAALGGLALMPMVHESALMTLPVLLAVITGMAFTAAGFAYVFVGDAEAHH